VSTETEILIVGTGFAGLGTAIRLAEQGRSDFTVIERAGDVGGTWRDNTYPGLVCDVPSHLYSFSFAPNPDWSCTYPGQAEILKYLRACADRYGIRRHIRFGTEMLSARWDGGSSRWHVDTTKGTFTAHFLVLGVGSLSAPRMPGVPGLDSFAGTMFHSAQWQHGHDLRGERVAVFGTGASAIQFIPRIQPRVARLVLFQRTPPWVLPHPNRRLTRAERWLARRVPAVLAARRLGVYLTRETMLPGLTVDPRFNGGLEAVARNHLRFQVRDPALRAKLTPRYRIGCKRIVISNDFYP
jgi:cation diffusion facilitator CzcD-associated flavoprotein CzcO